MSFQSRIYFGSLLFAQRQQHTSAFLEKEKGKKNTRKEERNSIPLCLSALCICTCGAGVQGLWAVRACLVHPPCPPPRTSAPEGEFPGHVRRLPGRWPRLGLVGWAPDVPLGCGWLGAFGQLPTLPAPLVSQCLSPTIATSQVTCERELPGGRGHPLSLELRLWTSPEWTAQYPEGAQPREGAAGPQTMGPPESRRPREHPQDCGRHLLFFK